jgi:hypothetical protein
MPRRDAFSGLRDPKTMMDVEENLQQSSTMISEQTPTGQPLDLIPTADLRKKRSRKWENAHRSETVTYRGVPRQTVEWIVEISQSLSVPRDEVVRAFLEYGLTLYRSGQLTLFAYPKARRMTLFPEERKTNPIAPTSSTGNHSWLKDAFPVPDKKESGAKKKQAKKSQGDHPDWELRVTYRIPNTLKEKICSIAEEHTLPVGEVVRFFIEKGSKAYQDGILPLVPVPKLIGRPYFRNEDNAHNAFAENRTFHFKTIWNVCVLADVPQTRC